jgi:Arc/MetJ-type ribon-helix-helix transcriptional regulator
MARKACPRHPGPGALYEAWSPEAGEKRQSGLCRRAQTVWPETLVYLNEGRHRPSCRDSWKGSFIIMDHGRGRAAICPDMLVPRDSGLMQIDFTPDQREFVQRAIASGRFRREEDAVKEALSLWEERERNRIEILAALDEAEAELSAGRYADYSREDSSLLAHDLKAEARALRRRAKS